jgi:hypothetical protein
MAKLGVKTTLVKKSNLPKLRGRAESTAIRILNELLQSTGLPTAKGLAPGSIPGKIFVIPATGGKGRKLIGGLGVPAKYLSVEFGAKPHLIEPVSAEVLLLEDGNFVMWAEHPGQEGQHFLFAGVTAVQEIAGEKIINGITGARSSGNRS